MNNLSMRHGDEPVQTETENVLMVQKYDDELVLQVLSGDLQAFEKIMRRNNQRSFRLARSFLTDDDEAMDVVQQAYVTAYTKLDQYRGPARLSAWLGQIVRNEALTRLRKARKVHYMDNEDVNTLAARDMEALSASSPEKVVANNQLRSLLEKSIDLLPEEFRVVFMMRGVEQLSTQETADLIGLNPATVKTRFHRARKMMQQHMNQQLKIEESHVFEFAGHRCDYIVETVISRIEKLGSL